MAEESHWGPSPYHPGGTRHVGAKENCSGPDCGPGIQIPENWGVCCPHGVRVVVHDPECVDEDGYPLGKVVDPWPCSWCTQDQFEADVQEQFENSMPSWEEIYGLN